MLVAWISWALVASFFLSIVDVFDTIYLSTCLLATSEIICVAHLPL